MKLSEKHKELSFRFHSIDALRFFAFLMVFFKHAPIDKKALPVISFLVSGGAVEFFFVISGFLFTFMLIREKEATGKLNFSRFYTRRSARTWPLYYALLALAYLLPFDFSEWMGWHMVSGGYYPSWKHSVLFLENYKMYELDQFPMISPLPIMWSLCIQEHFYFIWPIFMLLTPKKWLKPLLITGIFCSYGARLVYGKYLNNQLIHNHDFFTNFDMYAIGALLGLWVYDSYDKVCSIVSSIPSYLKWALLVIIFTCLKFDNWFCALGAVSNLIFNTIIAIIFVALILLFLPESGSFKFSTNNVFSKLGRITYGLYLYHILIIHSLYQFCLYQGIEMNSHVNYIGFICVAMGISIIISSASYKYFEMPLMRFAGRAEKIISTFSKKLFSRG